MNFLCYAHTAGLPWTCGLKSVSMYFSSDGVTQQVHDMIAGVVVPQTINFDGSWHDRSSQIYRKTWENSALGLPWDSFWSHFGASWGPSWTHAPKRLDFQGFGEGLGSPRQPTWLQLGGPKAPKSRPKPEKTDDEKQHVFCIDF